MNLDHNKMAGTGRTTRMLQHAFERARFGLASMILGDCGNGVSSLRHAMERILNDVDDLERRNRLGDLISYGTLGEMTRDNNRGISRFYDYGTHNFKFGADPNTEVLVDHYALERQLAQVITYLRAAQHLEDSEDWLIDTARMISASGRRVYLVMKYPEGKQLAEEELSGYNVSVEDRDHMSNLNILRLEMVGAHPNCVLLVDPRLLQELFDGALREINRWDPQPKMPALGPRDLYMEEALNFAKTHGPCMLVVDTLEGMRLAADALAAHGLVYRMSGSMSSRDRGALLEKFGSDTNVSYLVVTKQLAASGGWRILRKVSLAVSGTLSRDTWLQVSGRAPGSTARFCTVRA